MSCNGRSAAHAGNRPRRAPDAHRGRRRRIAALLSRQRRARTYIARQHELSPAGPIAVTEGQTRTHPRVADPLEPDSGRLEPALLRSSEVPSCTGVSFPSGSNSRSSACWSSVSPPRSTKSCCSPSARQARRAGHGARFRPRGRQAEADRQPRARQARARRAQLERARAGEGDRMRPGLTPRALAALAALAPPLRTRASSRGCSIRTWCPRRARCRRRRARRPQ